MAKKPRYDPGRYKLIGKLAVPEPDLMKWATWFETADRHVFKTTIGGCWVSTVFLGLDHNFTRMLTGEGMPILFETMIFRGGKGEEMWRCETWDQAEKQHKKACALVRREIKEKVNE
jgi:hypothetical protein